MTSIYAERDWVKHLQQLTQEGSQHLATLNQQATLPPITEPLPVKRRKGYEMYGSKFDGVITKRAAS